MRESVLICDWCKQSVPASAINVLWVGVRAWNTDKSEYEDLDYCPECWGKVDRLKGYEVWAGEAHTVFCHLLSLLNQGEWLPQGRQWPVVDKIRDMMFTCPNDIGTAKAALEATGGKDET